MKYYSDKLDQVFDTPEALEEAEAADVCTCNKVDDNFDDKNLKNIGSKVKDTAVNKIPSKKQLAADVDDADAKVKDAYAEYEVAKKQIEGLSKTYLESVDAILTPAKEAVKKAEEERYEAIRKFNTYYGAYQTVLTGDRAAKEMIRAINEINSIQRKIWNNTFWF